MMGTSHSCMMIGEATANRPHAGILSRVVMRGLWDSETPAGRARRKMASELVVRGLRHIWPAFGVGRSTSKTGLDTRYR